MKSTAIMELVAGYDAYTESDELQVGATAEAPATTPFCAFAASVGVSWYASAFSAKTINGGC
ncbi:MULTISPECIES: LxmA leader domain family RiPP [unclassified Streptomyces]|uniref:LxmA leader domain family RiPP n=1 Tax=unclassified Streptomyces TaxID=2593676 RepID=UPI0036654E5B